MKKLTDKIQETSFLPGSMLQGFGHAQLAYYLLILFNYNLPIAKAFVCERTGACGALSSQKICTFVSSAPGMALHMSEVKRPLFLEWQHW